MVIIRSEQDRRLIKSLSKKSKKKKINVYFNKKSKTGKSKYITGKFYSKKNEDYYEYKSSYELAYFMQLEANDEVINFMYEPFEIAYIDSNNSRRMYRPDLLILYKSGLVLIAEIKPEAMLGDYDVQAKASAARAYIKDNYKNIKIEYKFITEKMLFKDTKAYTDFLKEIKK